MVLDRLRRVTRDGRWIPEIDGLRCLAIAGVLFFHLSGEVQARSGRWLVMEPRYQRAFEVLSNGDRGVRLFFVISGMILAMPFARCWLAGGRRVSLGRYYLRRVTRLEPPYLLSVVLFTGMVVVWAHGIPAGFLRHAAASAVYLHGVVYGTMSPVNAVSWSLEIEVQFYLLAPLVMQLFRIRGKAVRRGVMAVLILLMGVLQLRYVQGPRGTMSVLFYLQYFVAGLLVADVFTLELPEMPSSWGWDVAGLVGLGCMFGFPREARWSHVVLPFTMALLILSAMRSHALRRVFRQPWIAVTGGMCYSIYLLHLPVMAATFKLTRRLLSDRMDFLGNFLVQGVLLMVPILGLSALFYVLVERPCMDPDWPGKLWMQLTGRRSEVVEGLDSAGVAE